MNKLKRIEITKFWGDKKVIIDFKKDINFLIGVNGSGKTTIINLVAAALSADFKTLDRIQFGKITLSLTPELNLKKKNHDAMIEVEKKENDTSPYPNITFKITRNGETLPREFNLGDIEEDHLFRHQPKEYYIRRKLLLGQSENDVYTELSQLVNLSWLSIHRTTSERRREERSYESSIDMKIEELQIDLVKYFSQLNRKYTDETELFQKNIFESLINVTRFDTNLFLKINASKEKNSLKSIFEHFKLNEKSYSSKLNSYFIEYEKSFAKYSGEEPLNLDEFSYLIGTIRIHSVVEKWNQVIDKQLNINKPKIIFLKVINSLLQRKELFINEKNELIVKTQSGKIFPLTNLSSGEKQLLIILGQSLLQQEKSHIYIADEPELSLHIEWQEKLVDSLKSLNINSQIIFATHSPDIVGQYQASTIKIENTIYE